MLKSYLLMALVCISFNALARDNGCTDLSGKYILNEDSCQTPFTNLIFPSDKGDTSLSIGETLTIEQEGCEKIKFQRSEVPNVTFEIMLKKHDKYDVFKSNYGFIRLFSHKGYKTSIPFYKNGRVSKLSRESRWSFETTVEGNLLIENEETVRPYKRFKTIRHEEIRCELSRLEERKNQIEVIILDQTN